jgi:3-isopropylmalate/(R)-2-methylmalate dehydratase large subunit
VSATAVGRQTISEKILSARSGTDARAGDIVVCDVDLVLGTDASSPMAIDYFEQMGGASVFDPARVMLAMDHYSPPANPRVAAYHDRMRAFARTYGVEVREVGEGISFQQAAELGRARPGSLVIGADSHTVTLGALNLFATGVGSSDLAAAMITGQVWLRVPETICVRLVGERPSDVSAKDVALELVRIVGAEGANYQALEFHGTAVPAFTLEDRLAISNLGVEMGAKASIFPFDGETEAYLAPRLRDGVRAPRHAIASDAAAGYSREIVIDVSAVSPRIALPHAPDNVAPLGDAIDTPVQMVFVGTCTGGRVSDIHEVLAVLERGGARVAAGIQLVVTPASEEVRRRLEDDGTLARLVAMGAVVTTAGCGACCGTSGVIPGDGMTVLSTANRNFKARMGNATASIYLASPAACAAAALTGRVTDPRSIGTR